MSNLYISLATAKTRLGIIDAATDAQLLELLEAVSRDVDSFCFRHFYTVSAQYEIIPKGVNGVLVPDVLSLSEFGEDSVWGGTVDTVWDSTYYQLTPLNKLPFARIVATPLSAGLCEGGRYFATGVWGHGDGLKTDPFKLLGITANGSLDTTTDTLTLSAAADVSTGDTLRLESEQVYVSALAGLVATIDRAVNGTVAATHADETAIERAVYPAAVVGATLDSLAREWNLRSSTGIKSESVVGDFSITYESGGVNQPSGDTRARPDSLLSRDEAATLRRFRRSRY